jgi:GT2 family glycosyltransferase
LATGADAVCILNNDITVEPEFLESLLNALQGQPDVGIVTPLVAEEVDGGLVWALGSAVNWSTAEARRLGAGEAVDRWRHSLPFEVEVASGSAMLIRRDLFERVGLMDEEFFLYYEETDWCLQVHRAGYRILAVPSAVVWHKVSATLGLDSPVIDYYMLRNHLRFISRHRSGANRLWLLARTVLRNMLTIAAYTAKSHGGARAPHRNARLLALRDAALRRWGKMGPDVEAVCFPER